MKHLSKHSNQTTKSFYIVRASTSIQDLVGVGVEYLVGEDGHTIRAIFTDGRMNVTQPDHIKVTQLQGEQITAIAA